MIDVAFSAAVSIGAQIVFSRSEPIDFEASLGVGDHGRFGPGRT